MGSSFIVQSLKTWEEPKETTEEMFQALMTYLKKGRDKQTRKLSRAITIFSIGPTTIVVKLWDTEIMDFHSSGRIKLRTDGFRTVSTKLMMESFLPKCYRLIQGGGAWYVVHTSKEHPYPWNNPNRVFFYEGICLPDAFNNPKKSQIEEAKFMALKKQIASYIKKLGKMLDEDTLEDPGDSDCFICQWGLSEENVSHVVLHLKEQYIGPSLVWNALVDKYGQRLASIHWNNYKTKNESDYCRSSWRYWKADILRATRDFVKKSVMIAR